MGTRKYSTNSTSAGITKRTTKEGFSIEEKEDISNNLVKNTFDQQTKILHNSLDKILLTHRNTRLFLFMLTGPFFAVFTFVKYVVKGSVFFILYKKGIAEKERLDK